MRKLLSVKKLIIALVIIQSNISLCQITIDSSDLLGLAGSSQAILEDKRFSIPVDVGSPGENQVWDFRSTTIVDSVLAIFDFFSSQGVDFSPSFPEANLAHKITIPEEPGIELFDYFNITSSHFINLGDSMKMISPIDTSMVSFQRDTIANLPMSYMDTWISTEADTSGFFPTYANISIDTTKNTIDGWGTVKLPMGDFECLRLRQDVKIINQTILNGSVFSSDTETYIQYDWIAKNVLLVANAQSQFGNTDPNFTDAHGFGRLEDKSGSTNVATNENKSNSFKLDQNYPNPFNPETKINYQIVEQGLVEIGVFNLAGQQVRFLVNEYQSKGNYNIQWNGTDDFGWRVCSGLYLYRLKVNNFIQTKKMLLLQ